MNTDIVICPGCGWVGGIHDLAQKRICPKCEYENGAAPFRLLTFGEMLNLPDGTNWNNVNMGPFLRSVVNEVMAQ